MECTGSISIREVGSKTEEVDLSYKIYSVGTPEDAKSLKEALDKFMSDRGAVTSLDEK
jgi:hypothetical protein